MHITSSISFSIHTYMHTYIYMYNIYILSCLTWTRTVGAHWRLRVISFGCRLSATAGLLREMYGSQGVRAQAVKKSLLLRSVCCVLLLFLASVYFSLVFHPLFKPQILGEMFGILHVQFVIRCKPCRACMSEPVKQPASVSM